MPRGASSFRRERSSSATATRSRRSRGPCCGCARSAGAPTSSVAPQIERCATVGWAISTWAPLATAKIPSRGGEISLVLEPAPKVIAELRPLFPHARIVGWKYELAGTPEEVWAKGARQIFENHTDLCVVNGAAYGIGFGLLEKDGARTEVRGKEALSEWLARWLARCG